MKPYKFKIILIIVFLFLVSVLFGISENDKITALLDSIENSKMVFIRNGTEYSALKARHHLEMKLKRSGSKVETAEDFIDYIASRSSWTGKYYLVRHPDGKKEKAANWLRKKLDLLNKQKKN